MTEYINLQISSWKITGNVIVTKQIMLIHDYILAENMIELLHI